MILKNWDEHVIISTTGLSLEESYCVPQNVVIIEGRCRDFTALREQKTSCKKKLPDTDYDLSAGFRFCLLKSFTPLAAVASITQHVTIQINSLTDLNAVEGFNLFSAKDFSNTKQLLDYLTEKHIKALFCADSVSDALIYSVALTGVVLVRTLLLFLYDFPPLFTLYCFLLSILFKDYSKLFKQIRFYIF